MAHKLIDCGLWFIAVLWLVQFLTEHSRHRNQRRNWRVGSPSILCERTGDWRVNLPSMGRRQGE